MQKESFSAIIITVNSSKQAKKKLPWSSFYNALNPQQVI